MKKFIRPVLIFLLPLIALIAVIAWDSISFDVQETIQAEEYSQEAIKSETKFNKDGIPELEWGLLHKLDYKSGTAPKALQSFHKKKVRIPGFIVPLNDNYTKLDEFLLVPDAMSCIHVPPPPPNLIVYVKLRKTLDISEVNNPSWVEGILEIAPSESQYGKAGFKMDGIKLEEFEF